MTESFKYSCKPGILVLRGSATSGTYGVITKNYRAILYKPLIQNLNGRTDEDIKKCDRTGYVYVIFRYLID